MAAKYVEESLTSWPIFCLCSTARSARIMLVMEECRNSSCWLAPSMLTIMPLNCINDAHKYVCEVWMSLV